MSRHPIVLLVHNIRSMWNVGSIFRCADAFGVAHIHFSGYTPRPPRMEISKTALGADGWIPWSSESDPLDVVTKRRKEGYAILSLEKTTESQPISTYNVRSPACLSICNEILGVDKALLGASDAILHIPMSGKKESLNVSVALGVALYQLSA